MKQKLCKNCKHSLRFDINNDLVEGQCGMIGGGDTLAYHDDYDYDKENGNRLSVSEWIKIPPNFGCIHWEAR